MSRRIIAERSLGRLAVSFRVGRTVGREHGLHRRSSRPSSVPGRGCRPPLKPRGRKGGRANSQGLPRSTSALVPPFHRLLRPFLCNLVFPALPDTFRPQAATSPGPQSSSGKRCNQESFNPTSPFPSHVAPKTRPRRSIRHLMGRVGCNGGEQLEVCLADLPRAKTRRLHFMTGWVAKSVDCVAFGVLNLRCSSFPQCRFHVPLSLILAVLQRLCAVCPLRYPECSCAQSPIDRLCP